MYKQECSVCGSGAKKEKAPVKNLFFPFLRTLICNIFMAVIHCITLAAGYFPFTLLLTLFPECQSVPTASAKTCLFVSGHDYPF